jgi:hypothetical protein
VEDTGTPSPWPEYAIPDFNIKQSWPATPTPSDATCDVSTLANKKLHLVVAQACQAPAETPECSRPAAFDLQTPECMHLMPMEGLYPALAQSCPALSEMLASSAVGQNCSIEGAYALAQTCPSFSGMTAPCAGSQGGLPLQLNFPGYEVDQTLHNVNESMIMQHAQQSWACEFNDFDSTSVGSGFVVGVQWPSFGLPQQSATQPEQSQGQWTDLMVEQSTCNQLPVPPPPVESPPEALPPQRRLPRQQQQQHQQYQQPQQQPQQQHSFGQCKPCAWFWRPQGCKNGDDCGYCHLCPEGALKARKKNKIAAMRMGALTPMKTESQKGGGWGLKLESLLQDDSSN